MGDLFRAGATGFVWVVFTVFMFGLFAMASDTYSEGYYFLSMAITGILAIFAFMLTGRIWRRAETPAPVAEITRKKTTPTARKDRTPATKAKRDQQERLATLMDALDEDDIIELETLVQARASDDSRGRS